jgi:hypothetical protein
MQEWSVDSFDAEDSGLLGCYTEWQNYSVTADVSKDHTTFMWKGLNP